MAQSQDESSERHDLAVEAMRNEGTNQPHLAALQPDLNQQRSFKAATPTSHSLLSWVICIRFHVLIIYSIECSTLICITAWYPAASIVWTSSRYPCDGA
jgi:hypothetical protein